MATQKKDFSVIKWILFPIIGLLPVIGIIFANTEIFGFKGSFPYYLALAVAFICGLVLIHFSDNPRKPVSRASYIFKALTLAVLGLNCAVSLSAMRKLESGRELVVIEQKAGDQKIQQSQKQVDALVAIGQLKSPAAQRTAARALENSTKAEATPAPSIAPTATPQTTEAPKTAAQVLAEKLENLEWWLFWIMCGEYAVSVGGVFTVYGLATMTRQAKRQGTGNLAAQPAVQQKLQKAGFAPPSGAQANIKMYKTKGGFAVHVDGKYSGFISDKDFMGL